MDKCKHINFVLVLFLSMVCNLGSCQDGILNARLLNSSKKDFNKQLFVINYKKFWGLSPKVSVKPNGDFDIFIGLEKLKLKIPKEPVDTSKLSPIINSNHIWTDAKSVCDKNRFQWVLTIENGNPKLLKRYELITKVAFVMALMSNSGVFVLNDEHMVQANVFINECNVLKKNLIPINSWFYVEIASAKGAYYAYTQGLANFGFKEIEILNSKQKGQDIQDLLYDVVSYVIENNANIEDGEELVFDALRKFKVQVSPGERVASETVKIPF
ncbi:MAG: DUF4261 domain-containing protein [Leadbetterella sp.]